MKKIIYILLLLLNSYCFSNSILYGQIIKTINIKNKFYNFKIYDISKSLLIYDISHERIKNKEIKYIINHYTVTDNIDSTLNAFIQNGTSSHFIIDRDGKIFQIVDESRIAYHAGLSYFDNDINLNENSIGIEHVNLGFVEVEINHKLDNKDICIVFNKNDKDFIKSCKGLKIIYFNNINSGEIFEINNFVDSNNNKIYNKMFFESFPKKQIESSIRLQKYLIEKYNIKPQNILSHSDIAVPYFRKQDPGPLFGYKLLAENGIGLFIFDEEIEYIKKQFPENILSYSYEKKINWFVNELIKFGYHDPIYQKINKENNEFIKYNNTEEYQKNIKKMIIIYNMHYRNEKKILDQIDDKDLLIAYGLNLKK